MKHLYNTVGVGKKYHCFTLPGLGLFYFIKNEQIKLEPWSIHSNFYVSALFVCKEFKQQICCWSNLGKFLVLKYVLCFLCVELFLNFALHFLSFTFGNMSSPPSNNTSFVFYCLKKNLQCFANLFCLCEKLFWLQHDIFFLSFNRHL